MAQNPRQFIVDRLGGVDALAERLSQRPNTVRMWIFRKRIPRAVWPEIVEAYPKVKIADLKALEAEGADA